MHTVPLTHQLVTIQDDFDLDKIIESGQCFRPQKLADGRYRFLSGGALLYLSPLGAGQYDAAWYGSVWECWANYFDLGWNYAALRCSLAGQSSYLDNSLDFGQGFRILHQYPCDMLFTFLFSQRKSIPAIRTAVERLARCCGEPLSAEGDEVFLFPTPQQRCGLSGAQLMGCGLGYRTRYIQTAAAPASRGTLDLGDLAALPDAIYWLPEALTEGGSYWTWLVEDSMPMLMSLTGGIGCLFGANHIRTTRRMRKKIDNIVGDAKYMYIQDIADAIPCSYEKCCKHLENCIDEGLFGPGAYLDMHRKCLVVKERPPEPTPAPAPAPSVSTENIASEISDNLEKLIGSEPETITVSTPAPAKPAARPMHPESATIIFEDLKFGRNYDPTASK